MDEALEVVWSAFTELEYSSVIAHHLFGNPTCKKRESVEARKAINNKLGQDTG